MSGTWRVVRAESYRLVRSLTVQIAALFMFLVPVLHVAAARFVDSAERLDAVRKGRKVLGLEEGRGWAPMVEAWRVGLALGALLLLIHGARSIAGDRESGVMRLASTRTASRSGLVLGRALLGPVLVLGVIVLTGLGAWATTRIWFDFGPLVEDGYVILQQEELLHELQRALLSALPALWAVHAFGLLISACSRGAILSVASSVALFLAFDLFKSALGESRFFVFASYSPSFIDNSAMQEMVGMAHGYSDAGFPESLLRMSYLLPAPQGLLFIFVAALVLKNRRL